VRALRNLIADRDAPPVAALLEERDPEAFLWRALPHAARTFSLAIALLRDPLGRSVGTAYLFCRALDTAEDLAADPASREAAIRAVVALASGSGNSVPIPEAIVQDARDLGHLAVLRRPDLLSALRASMSAGTRERLASLVSEMAEGMIAAAREKDASGGLLSTSSRPGYCDAVLGAPLRFAESEHRASLGADPSLPDDRIALSRVAGEVVQLANICRDVEKDLARGVAYDDALARWLPSRTAPPEAVAAVRRGLCLRVAELAPESARISEAWPSGPDSTANAAEPP
jgi:phytoene/squalene synthetase